MPRLTRPSDLVNHLAFISCCAPDFPPGVELTVASAIQAAQIAIDSFLCRATDERCEALLRACKEQLALAAQHYEAGSDEAATQIVSGAETMFAQTRPYLIALDHRRELDAAID